MKLEEANSPPPRADRPKLSPETSELKRQLDIPIDNLSREELDAKDDDLWRAWETRQEMLEWQFEGFEQDRKRTEKERQRRRTRGGPFSSVLFPTPRRTAAKTAAATEEQEQTQCGMSGTSRVESWLQRKVAVASLQRQSRRMIAAVVIQTAWRSAATVLRVRLAHAHVRRAEEEQRRVGAARTIQATWKQARARVVGTYARKQVQTLLARKNEELKEAAERGLEAARKELEGGPGDEDETGNIPSDEEEKTAAAAAVAVQAAEKATEVRLKKRLAVSRVLFDNMVGFLKKREAEKEARAAAKRPAVSKQEMARVMRLLRSWGGGYRPSNATRRAKNPLYFPPKKLSLFGLVSQVTGWSEPLREAGAWKGGVAVRAFKEYGVSAGLSQADGAVLFKCAIVRVYGGGVEEVGRDGVGLLATEHVREMVGSYALDRSMFCNLPHIGNYAVRG